jgi:hypothetical protein
VKHALGAQEHRREVGGHEGPQRDRDRRAYRRRGALRAEQRAVRERARERLGGPRVEVVGVVGDEHRARFEEAAEARVDGDHHLVEAARVERVEAAEAGLERRERRRPARGAGAHAAAGLEGRHGLAERARAPRARDAHEVGRAAREGGVDEGAHGPVAAEARGLDAHEARHAVGAAVAPQHADHVGGAVGPRLGVPAQEGVDDLAGHAGRVGGARPQRLGGAKHPRVHHGRERLALEGRAAREGFEEHHAEGVEVGAGADGLARHLLGREVGRRAHDLAGDLGVHLEGRERDAEVEHGGAPRGVDEHVGGLEVAVHHARGVDAPERLEEGHRGLDELLPRARRGAAREGRAVDAVHHHEGPLGVGALVEEAHHAGHVQEAQRGDLAAHARGAGAPRRVAQELPRHLGAGERVEGGPHLAVASAADGVQQRVAAPHGARHARRSGLDGRRGIVDGAGRWQRPVAAVTLMRPDHGAHYTDEPSLRREPLPWAREVA